MAIESVAGIAKFPSGAVMPIADRRVAIVSSEAGKCLNYSRLNAFFSDPVLSLTPLIHAEHASM
jgi:hypothetical protein